MHRRFYRQHRLEGELGIRFSSEHTQVCTLQSLSDCCLSVCRTVLLCVVICAYCPCLLSMLYCVWYVMCVLYIVCNCVKNACTESLLSVVLYCIICTALREMWFKKNYLRAMNSYKCYLHFVMKIYVDNEVPC